jgi:DNA polymerase-3 subunit gamma/tau
VEREQYEQTARLYTQEQCLDLIDYLLESTQKLRFAVSGKMALEAILLHVMRSHFRLPIEALVRRLCELEKNLEDLTNQKEIPPAPPLASTLKPIPVSPLPPPPAKVLPKVISETPKPPVESKGIVNEDPTPTPADLGLTIKTAKPPAAPKPSISTAKGPAYKYDTLFQFAAIELEGRLQRKA